MEKEEIIQLIKETMRQELDQMVSNDRFIFRRNIEFENNINIQLGRITGTKIGTDILEKLAFYGQTPVDRPIKVDDPAGGATVDSAARTAVEALIARLEELGLIAPN